MARGYRFLRTVAKLDFGVRWDLEISTEIEIRPGAFEPQGSANSNYSPTADITGISLLPCIRIQSRPIAGTEIKRVNSIIYR